MSNLRLLPIFASRYPVVPSAEERRTAYIMLNGFHMLLPEGPDRDAFITYIHLNSVKPALDSRRELLHWAMNCVRVCYRHDEDIKALEARTLAAKHQRQTRQLLTLGALVGVLGIVAAADKL
jgi:hypothetical protein